MSEQQRAANRRCIARMGGPVVDDGQTVRVVMDDPGDDPRIIRDATGEIVRDLR